MIEITDDVYINPVHVCSLVWSEYRTITITMVNGKDIVVTGADAARAWKNLVDEGNFWK